jgi:hypothetical protein
MSRLSQMSSAHKSSQKKPTRRGVNNTRRGAVRPNAASANQGLGRRLKKISEENADSRISSSEKHKRSRRVKICDTIDEIEESKLSENERESDDDDIEEGESEMEEIEDSDQESSARMQEESSH